MVLSPGSALPSSVMALVNALTAAAAAAREAAEGTASLRPLKGRARPLAEKSLGHPDPGAVSFGLIATRISKYVESTHSDAAPTDTAYTDAGPADDGPAKQGAKA